MLGVFSRLAAVVCVTDVTQFPHCGILIYLLALFLRSNSKVQKVFPSQSYLKFMKQLRQYVTLSDSFTMQSSRPKNHSCLYIQLCFLKMYMTHSIYMHLEGFLEAIVLTAHLGSLLT